MNRAVMTRAALGVFAVGLFLGRDLLAPRPAHGQAARAEADAKEEKRVLSTTGTGSVRFKPDSARAFLRVDTQAPDIAAARAQNNQHVQKVMTALKALGIPDLKTKSDNITVTEVFERHRGSDQPDKLPRVIGYKVSHH